VTTERKATSPTVARKEVSEADARSRIIAFLRKEAQSLSKADHDEVRDLAVDEWVFGGAKASPETCAKRRLLNHRRKSARRKTTLVATVPENAAASPEDAYIEALDAPRLPRPKKKAGRPRVKRYKQAEEKLMRKDIRPFAVRLFRKAFGCSPPGHLTTMVAPNVDLWAFERQARSAFDELRTAMLVVSRISSEARSQRTFAKRTHGNCIAFLKWWVPEFVDPLLKHAALERSPKRRLQQWSTMNEAGEITKHERLLDVSRWPPVPTSQRERLVQMLDKVDLLGFQTRGMGTRWLVAREFAVVWLCAGGWPAIRAWHAAGLSLGDVVEIERKAFDEAIHRIYPDGDPFVRGSRPASKFGTEA
jgi:hypothetical protein